MEKYFNELEEVLNDMEKTLKLPSKEENFQEFNKLTLKYCLLLSKGLDIHNPNPKLLPYIEKGAKLIEDKIVKHMGYDNSIE